MQETTYIDLLHRKITSCKYYFLMEYSIFMTVSTIALWANLLSQYNKKDSQESMIHGNGFLLQSSLHITHNTVWT
jgi:hypothetical protein